MSAADKAKLDGLISTLATQSAAGYMSAADKAKLDGLISTLATQSAAGYMSAADKAKLDDIDLSLYALLNSPTFTGIPKAPTPASNDNSTNIATTAFVNSAAVMKKASTQGTITVNSTNVSASYSGYYYANGIGSATICIQIADNSDTQTVWKDYPIMTLSPAPKLLTKFVFVSQENGLGVTVLVDTTGLVTLEQKKTTFNNKWLWGGLTFPVDA
jgi:hypothetical protein